MPQPSSTACAPEPVRVPAVRPLPFPVASVGYLVEHGPRETLRYQVHSRFQHALNLTSSSGELLTLLSPRYPNLPTAIRVATPAGWDWRHQSDSRFSLEKNVLRGENWSADLNRVPCWRPEPRRAPDTAALGAVLAAYPTLASQLARRCRLHEVRSSLQLVPGWPSEGRLPRLNPGDTGLALEHGISELIGYGSGLTPDGDDYLLGYLSALWPWQRFADIAVHLKSLRRVMRSQLHRTTSISRHYLALALQGHFSQPIDHLTSVLMRGDALSDVFHSAGQVMEFGSASGVDCLAGFLHGIRTLETVTQAQAS